MTTKYILSAAIMPAVLLAGCANQSPVPVIDGMGEKLRTFGAGRTQEASRHNQIKTAEAQAVKAPVVVERDNAVRETRSVLMEKDSVEARVHLPKNEISQVVPSEPKIVQHRVLATDTIYKLARDYETSPQMILTQNGLNSATDIKAGQILAIPAHSKPQVSAWNEVKKMLTPTPAQGPALASAGQGPGERQVAIPSVAQVSQPVVAPVLAAKDIELQSIEPAAGERPVAHDVPVGVGYINYKVQPKETIYRISLKYNVSVLDIMAANEFAEPQDLKADSMIRVPVKNAAAEKSGPADKQFAAVAPSAGVTSQIDAPVQIAMRSDVETVKSEELESKAIKQEAFKDSILPPVQDKPLTADAARKAELKRGQIDPVAAKSKGLVWPVKGQIVKKFGDDGSGVARTGINIAVPKDTPVLASESGTVLYADDGLKIYGKLVLLRHDNGMVSAYAHNGYLLVKKNERVKKGQVIALSGASGNVESPQLHFEVRQHASAIDPMRVLPSL